MKRLLITLGVIAVLGLNTPHLLADHGDKGSKHQQGNKHGDNDQGWEPKTWAKARDCGRLCSPA